MPLYDRGMTRTAASPVGRSVLAGSIGLALLLLALPLRDAFEDRPDVFTLIVGLVAVEAVLLLTALHPAFVVRSSLDRPAQSLNVRNTLWLALICVPWSWLIVLTPDASYLGLALYFLALWLLPPVTGSVAAIVLAALTATGQGVHHGWSSGAVLGPLAGAAILIVVMIGFRALMAESAARAALIAELRSTQSRLAETEREAGVLAERARLGRELHDTVAQHLSSIQLLIHAAEAHGAGRDAASAGALVQAREAAAAALADTRAFIKDLAPTPLQEASFETVLERLARDAGAEFECTGTVTKLPVPVEAALVRITQEALQNTAKYAGDAPRRVTVECEDDQVVVEIADEGPGFVLEEAGPAPDGSSGYGIPGMRARAAALGGYLAVVTAPGEGTLVRASIPIPLAHAEEPTT